MRDCGGGGEKIGPSKPMHIKALLGKDGILCGAFFRLPFEFVELPCSIQLKGFSLALGLMAQFCPIEATPAKPLKAASNAYTRKQKIRDMSTPSSPLPAIPI